MDNQQSKTTTNGSKKSIKQATTKLLDQQDQWLTINNGQATIDDRQLTTNNQQSAINYWPSTINHQRPKETAAKSWSQKPQPNCLTRMNNSKSCSNPTFSKIKKNTKTINQMSDWTTKQKQQQIWPPNCLTKRQWRLSTWYLLPNNINQGTTKKACQCPEALKKIAKNFEH